MDLALNRSFIFVSRQYYHLVTTVLTETIRSGNTGLLVDAPMDVKEASYKYNKITKWSDFNIILPILFNFFHAIELNLKGLLFLTSNSEKYIKRTHRLTYLLKEFTLCYESESELTNLFNYYINPDNSCPLLHNFYSDNSIDNSSKFFEIYKYPKDGNFDQSYRFNLLKRQGRYSIGFMEKLIGDVKIIQKETRKIRSLVDP